MSEVTNINDFVRPHLRESLDKVRPEMVALKPEEYVPITVEPLAVATTIRGALPRIMAIRVELEALSGFDIHQLDNLDLYVRALMQAHTIHLGASAPPEHFSELVTEATTLRVQFLSDATALANRGLLDGSKLDTVKGPVGYRNVASDLLMIANMLRGNWATVGSKTAVTEAELDRAEIVGDQLVNDIGVRNVAPAVVAAVALERQQTFTLAVNAYDHVRRGVGYVRWDHGDADEIAPSLYSGRRKKGSETKAASEVEPANTKSEAAPTVAAPAATPVAAKPGVGLPGADPFLH